MNKNKILFINLFIFFIAFIGGVLMLLIQKKGLDIKPFEVDEYQYYIDNYSSQENLGNIIDSKDLIDKVEEFWIRMYGENVKNQRPYQIFYDKENAIWLVRGNMKFHKVGGVANILVEHNTGNVLAVWHEK